jgi:hypothetical protein
MLKGFESSRDTRKTFVRSGAIQRPIWGPNKSPQRMCKIVFFGGCLWPANFLARNDSQAQLARWK